MTPTEMEKAAHKIYGRKYWKTTLSRALGVDVVTVHRMMHRAMLPGPWAVAIAALLDNKKRMDELNRATNQLMRDRERIAKATRVRNKERKKLQPGERQLIPYAGKEGE